jgi:sigma-E factor negative regulatory protein RseA
MTEQINDQISAFIDDELSADESAMLVRRFERDTAARAQALRYTLIGSALRGELLEPHPAVLRRRVAAAIAGVTPTVARAPARWSMRVARPLLGFGIAAAVAVVAIGVLRAVNDTGSMPSQVAATSPALLAPLQARDAVEAPSYVVPQEVAQGRVATPPIRLTNYLMHHGEYASGLSRTSVHSNVVSAAKESAPAAADRAEVRE